MSDTLEVEEQKKETAEMKAGDSTLREIYGSFFVKKTELAVNIEFLQEVVNFPTTITTMPLAPDYLIGFFNLRGTIVPVVNLKKLMRIENDEPVNSQKIAILDYGGAHVGFAFDATGEILRPKPEEKSDFFYKKGSDFEVIKGALKLGDGSRLLQILDPEALVSIQNIPQLREYGESRQGKRLHNQVQHQNRKKCISFLVCGAKLAFEITGIHEIVNVPEIQHSPMESEICTGMISLRGQVIPVLNFPYLLKRDMPKQDDDPKVDVSNRRIIVLKLESEFFGLLVDMVESINAYTLDDIMPIPLLSQDRMKMFQGCIALGETGDVILLNQKEILSNEEILQVTHGHAKLYQASRINEKNSAQASANKQVYISFRLNHLFGVPIVEVKEIINYAKEILDAPGMPAFVKGMLNLRGKLVTVIDTRSLYGLDAKREGTDTDLKIIIFQIKSEQFGLVVDSVESIVTVNDQDKLKLPDLFKRGIEGTLQKDVKEVIDVPHPDGKNISLVILNVESVIERLCLGVAI